MKKHLHQESACFRSSKSFKRNNYAVYTTCMYYRWQALIITQRTSEVDGMNFDWKLTKKYRPNVKLKLHVMWSAELEQIHLIKSARPFFMNEINNSAFREGIEWQVSGNPRWQLRTHDGTRKPVKFGGPLWKPLWFWKQFFVATKMIEFLITKQYILLDLGNYWSRHAIAKTTVFEIAIFYASFNVRWHQTFLMLIFYTTYQFLSKLLM